MRRVRPPAAARRRRRARAWPSAARQGRAQAPARARSRARSPAVARAIERAVAGAQRPRRRPRELRRAARAARAPGLPARLLARGRRRDQLPPLLRHQRPRGAAHGEPTRCSRRRTALVLDARCARARSTGCASTTPTASTTRAQYFRACRRYASCGDATRPTRPLYVVIEKIVAPHENLPEAWAGARHHRLPLRQRRERRCSSTTRGGRASTRIYRGVRRRAPRLRGDRAARASALILRAALAARAHRARHRAWRASRAPTAARATSRSTRCATALAEVVARFPVYRTYIVDAPSAPRTGATSTGRSRRRARGQPRRRRERLRLRARMLLARSCRPRSPALAADDPRTSRRKFQQFTSPVMAKGVEDTAFYRYNRLRLAERRRRRPATSSACPVAALPRRERATARAHWPHTMLATSTHDNKRSRGRARAHRRASRRCRPTWRLLLRALAAA